MRIGFYMAAFAAVAIAFVQAQTNNVSANFISHSLLNAITNHFRINEE
jgi:hypothetical protein